MPVRRALCNSHEVNMAPNASLLVTLGIPTLAVLAFAVIAFASITSHATAAGSRGSSDRRQRLARFTGSLASAGFYRA